MRQLSLWKAAVFISVAFQPFAVAQPNDPIHFVKASIQASPLIDIPGDYDYQPSALRTSGGTGPLAVWYCGQSVLPDGPHDGIFRALPVIGSTVAGSAVLNASSQPARYDALHLCHPAVFRHAFLPEPERYYMYYECSPFLYDMQFKPVVPVSATSVSLNHICLARSDDGVTWKVYSNTHPQTFGDPATTSPTPVLYPSAAVQANCQLSDDISTPSTYAPPINGRLWGNPTACADIAVNYGVGGPSVVTIKDWPTGGRLIRLYYWDSLGTWPGRLKRATSWDGFHFSSIESTNLTVGGKIKYFPNLRVNGQTGIWVATTVFDEENWYAYSYDGLNFQQTPLYPPDHGGNLELPEARPDLCVAPSSPTFVGNEYGFVNSTLHELISNEGYSGSIARCFNSAETPAINVGSTWAMYYMTGIFADLRAGDVNYCQ